MLIESNYNITIKNSTFRFSNIKLNTLETIDIDGSSVLNATGMGRKDGDGHVKTFGASYAAQGGYCTDSDPGLGNIYGTYNMSGIEI